MEIGSLVKVVRDTLAEKEGLQSECLGKTGVIEGVIKETPVTIYMVRIDGLFHDYPFIADEIEPV